MNDRKLTEIVEKLKTAIVIGKLNRSVGSDKTSLPTLTSFNTEAENGRMRLNFTIETAIENYQDAPEAWNDLMKTIEDYQNSIRKEVKNG